STSLTVMAIVVGSFARAVPVGPAAGSGHSHPHKAQCKQIREAVSAGRTMEQITAEFNTDAEHVMKCVQTRGKRKKGKSATQPEKPKHTSSTGSTATHTSSHPH